MGYLGYHGWVGCLLLGWIVTSGGLAEAQDTTSTSDEPVTSESGEATGEVTDEAGPVDLATVRALNGQAMTGAVTDVLHGVEIADPFRALEEDSPETRQWIAAQTALASQYFDQWARPERAARLQELLSIGYFTNLSQAGGRIFFTKRDGDLEQPALFVLEPGSDEPRQLLDPNAIEEHLSIDFVAPSPQGTYVAYGLSHAGDERSTTYVLRTETGEVLSDAIDHTKWISLSWLNDETGFYYTRYPRPGEEAYDAESEDTYDRHLFFHALGTDPTGDPLVYRAAERTDFVSSVVDETDRYLLIIVSRGWSQSDLFLLDREDPTGTPQALSVGGDYIIWGNFQQGRLYLVTNEDHPRYRVLVTDPTTATDRSTWQEVIPEGPDAIESVAFAQDTIIVHAVVNVASALRLYALDGTLRGEVELPTLGSVGELASEPGSTRIVFQFSSPFHPPVLYAIDTVEGALTVVDRVMTDIDPEQYASEQVWVASEDGTQIPVHLVYRRDLPRDVPQPVLLTGYGGFSVSMLPTFQRNVIYWLERGGIFATAALRGGGEFGEEWHRDGMMENKHHVFEDFEAVIRWLSSSGTSSPDRIAITGGSNGGLLMGAMITRCAEAFAAVVSSVGLYDMVRFSQFPPAEIWMTEYGDPEVPEQLAALYAYSPYHHVVQGTAYPSILIVTAENDTRVSWQHSTKFTASLQEATSSPRPVLFFMQSDAGHGAGSGLSAIVQEYVRLYTFVEQELGMTE